VRALELAVGGIPAHRRHAAVGAGDDPFAWHVLHRFADHGRHLLGRFHLVGRDIDHADLNVLAVEEL